MTPERIPCAVVLSNGANGISLRVINPAAYFGSVMARLHERGVVIFPCGKGCRLIRLGVNIVLASQVGEE